MCGLIVFLCPCHEMAGGIQWYHRSDIIDFRRTHLIQIKYMYMDSSWKYAGQVQSWSWSNYFLTEISLLNFKKKRNFYFLFMISEWLHIFNSNLRYMDTSQHYAGPIQIWSWTDEVFTECCKYAVKKIIIFIFSLITFSSIINQCLH